MPEKCQYCGEDAVIEDSVDGGKEQFICIECGSLATGLTAKGNDSLYYELTNAALMHTEDDDNCSFCKSCGSVLNDTLCLTCSQENLIDENGWTDDSPDCDHENEIEPTKKAGKSNNEIKCISCSGENLSTEAINGDERLICTDCGSVNSNYVLTAEEFHSQTRTKNNDLLTLPRFHTGKKVVRGLEAGIKEIHTLSSKYCFSQEMKAEAEKMFQTLFYHTDVKNVTICTKQNIAAACLIIVCRQHNLPISLTRFKNDVIVFGNFLRAVRLVLKVLDIQLPHMSVTNMLTSFLTEIGLGRGLTGKAKDILFLYRKAWLTQGRSRNCLITIATYYAYVSSEKYNDFIFLKQFCQQHKIPLPNCRLVKQCKDLLLKLAQSLPWIKKESVTERNLPFYINDVIKYQEGLFHLVFQSDNDDVNAQAEYRSPDMQMEDPKVHCGIKRKEVLMPSASKIKRVMRQDSIQSTVPPDINLDSSELKETEFEEEINSYILSPGEQANIKEHKMNIWKS